MQGNPCRALAAWLAFAVAIGVIPHAVSEEISDVGDRSEASTSAVPFSGDHTSSPKSKQTVPQYILGTRTFSIPFTVDGQDTERLGVRLYVLSPAQARWQLHRSIALESSDVGRFEFVAEQDGEYQFMTRTLGPIGEEYQTDKFSPEISVFVDTTQPKLTMSLDVGVDGEILVHYAAEDATQLQKKELRYATDSSPAWVNIPEVLPATVGNLRVQPQESDHWNYATVELLVTDSAGNSTRLSRQVRRPRIAAERVQTASKSLGAAALAGFRNEPASGSDEVTMFSQSRGSSRVNVEGGSSIDHSGDIDFRDQRSDEHAVDLISTPLSDFSSRSTSGVQTNEIRIAQLGNPPRRKISLFEKLFGVTPPANPSTLKVGSPMSTASDERLYATPLSMSSTPARLVGNPQELLPPPASAAQISDGFGLNGPAQNQSKLDEKNRTRNAVAPNNTTSEILPETLPIPGTRQQQLEVQSSIANRQADTPAQAMRPIGEASQVLPLLQQQSKPSSDVNTSDNSETLPLYEAKRSDVPDSGLAGETPESFLDRVPVRFSKSKRFSLDYELEAIGLQGAESIELYGTTDSGKTWQLWGSDPDRLSPFDIETQDVGAFGFRICVVGRNGLASPRPLVGELPDIVVVVDTEKPEVRITGARYGEGSRVGSLVITYECFDQNLPQRPITLAFSDSLEGPWTTIAGGLRNEGQYIWAADPTLPRQLYLRIDAIDEAGNRGVYLLDQPIDTQGLAPRAKIRGFQPLSRGDLNPEKPETTAGRAPSQF
ncbi:hypothetical protein N9M41_07050 [Rhodopirellula sp.]|nr:hypothetical protein [Rhodopirellula sp.]